MASLSSVTISARVPTYSLTIFGYTSPNSRVELSNATTFAAAYSDSQGYFLFDHLYLPRHSQDLCLSSQDESNRLNNPTCFPEPPINLTYSEIGPVLLSPTISLDLTSLSSSGQSIPNTALKIYLYRQDSPLSFVKSVSAFSLPILETKTDAGGNYSLNLPATTANYRLFASAEYLGANSPKSNTLLYQNAPGFSFLLFLLPLLIISLSLFFLFKKSPRRFLPALFYNKDITPYHA